MQMLYLDRTAVTDAGLAHLRSLPKLRVLWVKDTRISDEGIRKLQQALPDCEIQH